MNRTRLRAARAVSAVAGLVLLAHCASPEQTVKAPPPEPALARNVVPFDVAVCVSQMPVLPEQARADALNGWLLSADPMLRECWMNPAHRTAESVARVEVELTLDSRGTHYDVSGKSLTASGVACMKKALTRLRPQDALPDNQPPLSTKRALTFDAAREDVVRTDVDAASQAAGSLRLALAQACPCFASWTDAVPKTLALTMAVDPAQTAPALAFDLTNHSASDELAVCLQTELAKAVRMPPNTPSFRYALPFIHSGVAQPLLGGPLKLRLQHLESVRRRKLAATLVRWATRDAAAQLYERTLNVAPSPKVSPVRRKAEKHANCRNLVLADDRLIDALGELSDVESELQTLGEGTQSKEALAAAAQRRMDTTKELQQARTARARDAVPCPRD